MSTLVSLGHKFLLRGSRRLVQKLVYSVVLNIGQQSWGIFLWLLRTLLEVCHRFLFCWDGLSSLDQVPLSAVWCSSHQALPQLCLLLSIFLPHTVIYFLRWHEKCWSSRRQAGKNYQRVGILFHRFQASLEVFFTLINPWAKILEVFDFFQVAPCLGDQSDIFFDNEDHEFGFLSHSFGVLLSQQLFQLRTTKPKSIITFAGCLGLFRGVAAKPNMSSSFPIATYHRDIVKD